MRSATSRVRRGRTGRRPWASSGSEAVSRVVVRTVPCALALTGDGEVEAYVPDRVHDAERAQALGEVGRGLPDDGLALVPHGGHREAEGLEAHARTAARPAARRAGRRAGSHRAGW